MILLKRKSLEAQQKGVGHSQRCPSRHRHQSRALPALLPFFKEALNLSYTTSGVILLAANLTSSIIQPAFGHLSDRHPFGWFLPLAPFVACLGLALTGLVSNYSLLLVCVIVTGIGIASFHPEGFKTAFFFTGDKKATGMSFFAVGGTLGLPSVQF